jgi:hypothetical protein
MPNDDRKLTLEWVAQADGSRALVFVAVTWEDCVKAAE